MATSYAGYINLPARRGSRGALCTSTPDSGDVKTRPRSDSLPPRYMRAFTKAVQEGQKHAEIRDSQPLSAVFFPPRYYARVANTSENDSKHVRLNTREQRR